MATPTSQDDERQQFEDVIVSGALVLWNIFGARPFSTKNEIVDSAKDFADNFYAYYERDA